MRAGKNRPAASPRKQRGVLLVVTLVFLLIVSMLAISTMDTTGLEMRMASNSRDQQQAFEAAEFTLSWVESEIIGSGGFTDNSLSNTACGNTCFDSHCSNGYCFAGSNPLDWASCSLDSLAPEPHTLATRWADGSGQHRTVKVSGADITGKYLIEYRCFTPLDPEQTLDATNHTKVYRITAFATGEGGRGRAMLRSTIRLP